MRILFVTRHFGCLRNYELAIQRLAEVGHTIHLAALHSESEDGLRVVERLAAVHGSVSWGWAPVRDDAMQDLATRMRLATDYLRYLQPRYRDASRLRARARYRTPVIALAAAAMARPLPGMRTLLRRGLAWLEDAIPVFDDVAEFLRAQRPDVVLLTPLIGLGTQEEEFFRAAKVLGQRVVYCVWSWDNLSTKSIIRRQPDAVTVWNETQRHEALELHGIPPERVIVTGAQCFDRWFDRSPSRSRAEFCASQGLDPSRPLILWVCSALFQGSPPEAPLVRRWIEELRRDDGVLRDANIVVRPHPARLKEWQSVPVDGLDNVSFWGSNPIDRQSRADYYDSLHHADIVVGLNTSAFLEGAIAGRPIHTLLLPEFRDNQEETLHFRYLQQVEGGLLEQARDFSEHRAKLATTLAAGRDSDRSRAFVRAFLRPHGLEVEASGRFAEAIEEVGRRPLPAAQSPARPLGLLRSRFEVLARLARMPGVRQALRSPVEAAEERRRNRALRAHKTRRRRILRDRMARKSHDEAGKAARRRSKAQARALALRAKRRERRFKRFNAARRGLVKRCRQALASVRDRLLFRERS